MNKRILKNGLPIFFRRNKDINTISLFLLVRAGSNYEVGYPAGTAHLMEHLFYKGNESYSKEKVAEYFEYVGGGLRASTSKELMTFDITIPKKCFNDSVQMMASLLVSPKFTQNHIDDEIQVIKQEIALYEDSPEDLLMDITESSIWKGMTLEHPILGTRESLELIKKEDVERFYTTHFVGANMALACYGNIDEVMLDKLESLFSEIGGGKKISYHVSRAKFGEHYRKNMDFSQNYFNYIYPANSVETGKHWYEYLLCDYIGSGMNSLLYKKLREELQLIYDVSMYYENFLSEAVLVLQLGADKGKEKEIIDEIQKIHLNLKTEAIQNEQFNYLKEKVKNQFIIDYADELSQLLLQMRSELLYDKGYTLEEILSELEDLTLDEFQNIIKNRFLYLDYSLFQFV